MKVQNFSPDHDSDQLQEWGKNYSKLYPGGSQILGRLQILAISMEMTMAMGRSQIVIDIVGR